MRSNKKKYGLLVVVVFCFMSVTQIAEAQLPNCTTGFNLQMYNAGYWGGWSMVSQAWGAIDDCDQVKYNTHFQDTILNALADSAAIPKPNEWLECRFLGYNQGANDKLQEIKDDQMCAF